MELLPGLILGVVAIALSTSLSKRLGVAGPLILVAVGLAASWLPILDDFEVDPELILVGVLPPLLYAAAVRLPAVEFRRDLPSISGLAVALVVVSALAVGGFLTLVLPQLGFPLAVALGAVLSPSDAVATSIVKRLGISPRVVTILEGESLINDATALVLLRSAIAAVAGGFAFADTVGTFVWGIVAAVIVGVVVGGVNLRVRARMNTVAATALGFIVPFVAYLPTEHLGGSGLVAAVAAGITTGQGAARRFTAEQRVSDEINWRTVELVLEGGVFLVMGLELRGILDDNFQQQSGPGKAILLALGSLAILLFIRAVYVAGLIFVQGRRARLRQRDRLEQISEHLDNLSPDVARRGRNPGAARRRLESMRSRVTRAFNDLDYYEASPLGWKHGTIIVWAGMRGVVTLAAAQTLPRDTPERELLILTAFLVAVISLLLQGLTLPGLVRALRIPSTVADSSLLREEEQALDAELRTAAIDRLADPTLAVEEGGRWDARTLTIARRRLEHAADEDAGALARELQLLLIGAMRSRLLELSREGAFSSEVLRESQRRLDSQQVSLEMRQNDL
ncbi:cation:proton antiporter [Microbacterium arborescens]|uniref:cation:proton antiporter n=1 Tax=Microbacterium arborescens TaxID=33883 RepID=UPI0025A21829|nr:cation:proton antiporter [Microbacterium arborescens]MDF2581261.1 sodium:proton antiporter [Microbacterium sp.]WJM15969.1 cation:proton antiporter [Microbacterium arborescens]